MEYAKRQLRPDGSMRDIFGLEGAPLAGVKSGLLMVDLFPVLCASRTVKEDEDSSSKSSSRKAGEAIR